MQVTIIASKGKIKMTYIMINILIANDQPIGFNGFYHLINDDPELSKKFRVDKLWMKELSEIKPPDIMLLVLNQQSNFSSFSKVLKKLRVKPKLIIHFDEIEFRVATQLLQYGVSGLVSQRSAPSELVNCLRQVAANGSYICHRSAKKILAQYRSRMRKIP